MTTATNQQLTKRRTMKIFLWIFRKLQCNVYIGKYWKTIQYKYTTMLTLETEVHKLIGNLPKKEETTSSEYICTHEQENIDKYTVFKIPTPKIKKTNQYKKGEIEILLEKSIKESKCYITQIEENWEYRSNIPVEYLKSRKEIINQTIKGVSKIIKTHENTTHPIIKTKLKSWLKTLKHEKNAISDAITYKELEVEIAEYRKKPQVLKKIKRAENILDSIFS
jgi:hypothetical protein